MADELDSTRTDIAVPPRDVGALPMISAEQYQHVGRFGGALVLSAFEMIGGLPRFARWADGNPTDFYTKLFPKIVARSQQIDHTGSLTIDDAITRLERQATPAPRVEDADWDEMPDGGLQYDL